MSGQGGGRQRRAKSESVQCSVSAATAYRFLVEDRRRQADGDAHFGDARLAAGGEHGGDVLKRAVGVAADDDAELRILPLGVGQRLVSSAASPAGRRA